jgi:hypothetical protein
MCSYSLVIFQFIAFVIAIFKFLFSISFFINFNVAMFGNLVKLPSTREKEN